MASDDMYLIETLTKYQVGKTLKETAWKTFSPIINQWASTQLLSFDFSGSTAKGTEVSCSSDVDFFISLDQSTKGTLEEIYESLFSWLSQYNDISVRKQNVSLGVTWNGYKLDFTPARKQSGNTHDHSLYKYRAKTWTQTNVQRHINIVQGSQRTFEIKLFKIWRENHQLEWPSIFLELFVIDALKGCSIQNFSGNFLHVLRNIYSKIETKYILDPSNTNNIISNDLTADEKIRIRNQAYHSLQSRSWGHIVW